MSLKIDTSRAPHMYRGLHDLLRAVGQAAAEDETEWIEWKSSLDLGEKSTRATLARHIIGMANRRVEEAMRFAGGFGYVLVGIEPGNRCGVAPVDFANLRPGIEQYLGPHGPRWTASYDTEDGPPVLIVIVDPPRDADPIYALQREFGKYRAGDIFVRKLGSTEKADPGDLDYLARRAVPRTLLTRRRVMAAVAVASGLSAAGWELVRTSSNSKIQNPLRLNPLHPGSGSKLWSSPVLGVAINSPVAVGRSVFVSTVYDGKDAYLYALRESDGSQIWSMEGRGTGEFSSPVVADGVVCVGTENSEVQAVRADDGTRVWSYSFGGENNMAPVAGSGVIYVVAGSELIALRTADGTRLWTFHAGTPVLNANVVYADGQDGSVYALRADDGTQIWKSRFLGAVTIQVIAGNALYVSESNDRVYALDASDGGLLWSFGAGGNAVTGIAIDAETVFVGTGISYSGALSPDTADGYLYALQARDGTLLWRFPAKGGVYNIVASGEAVYLSTADAHIYALHPNSGSVIWSFAPIGNWQAGPVIAGSTIYLGAGSTSTSYPSGISVTAPGGHIYALHASNGRVIWNFRTGSIAGRPVAADGIVYDWSYDGNVYAIRA
jgi:outer membrane protein assembly factor BamB